MASLERTAYPTLPKAYSKAELQRDFSFSDDEIKWVRSKSKAPFHLNLAVLLKTFQVLRYFPDITDVPIQLVDFIRGELGQRSKVKLAEYKWFQQYRHMNAIRARLGVTAFYGSDAMELAERHAKAMSFVLDQRADIINSVIEELISQDYELPAYSTLNDLAERIHAESQEAIFNLVVTRTPVEVIHKLKDLLDTDFGRRQSDFNALKQAPKKPSRKHLEVLIDHLAWLESLGDLDAIFGGIVDTKIRHFAAQAAASDVAELKDCSLPKRYTLMLALIYRMRVRTRDHLAEMFIRRISTIHKRAKEELERIQARQRQKLEQLAATLDGVVQILVQEPDDQEAGSLIREYLSPGGNLDRLRETCAEVQATGGNNYLPLIWKHFKSHRSLLFRLSHLLQLEPTTQDRSLVQNLQLIQDSENLRR
ncbi:uncharacterized protein DUF4158 [Pseudomonas sp. JUb52]|nr:uncharacterized protein DUF4158 [Pseudomonas sp. JUb52]